MHVDQAQSSSPIQLGITPLQGVLSKAYKINTQIKVSTTKSTLTNAKQNQIWSSIPSCHAPSNPPRKILYALIRSHGLIKHKYNK